MADISNITLPNGENYDIKDKAARNDIAINRTTLGYQCKNLFDWKNAIAVKSGGVTFNKSDNDISVTSSGAWAFVAYKLPDLEIGIKHTFSATVSNLSKVASTVKMRLSYGSGGGSPITDIDLTDNGEYKASFIPTMNTVYVLFYPNFSADVYTNSFTVSDIMLRYADILADTYEPYKESVDERLIKNKSDIAVNKTTLGYQCKNLFKNTAVSQTAYGVTFTVNDDKSIIVDGTATRNIYFNIGEYYFEADKQYILNGCPSGGSGTKYFLAYSGMAGHQYDTGSGTTFSVSESVTKAMLLVIVSGQTVSNLTFKPMLRDADIIDATYEPYQPSVQEQINALEARIAALGG